MTVRRYRWLWLIMPIVLLTVFLVQWLHSFWLVSDYISVEKATTEEPLMKTNTSVSKQMHAPDSRTNITIGVVANEFFHPNLRRTGGFGMQLTC